MRGASTRRRGPHRELRESANGPPDGLRKRSGGPFGAPPGKSFEPKNLKSDEYMFLIGIKRVYP